MKHLAGLILALAALGAAAQPYPSKPVRIVNAFPPGGPTDFIARLVTDKLSKDLGVAIVNENRAGAAGNIGAAEVARAAPDGHTALLAVFSIVTSNPHLYPGALDPLKDLAPVTMLASFDSVLIAHPSVPASNVKELIAYAKANPGKLNYASAGKASPGHLTGENFRVRSGAVMTHVPYKGNAEAVRSVLAGETQIMFTPTTVTLPLIREGKLKALGVYLTDSVDALPGVQSLQAQGVEGFDARSLPAWYGLLVPAGTPREAVARLNGAFVKALRDPDIEPRLRAARIFVVANSPEEFGAQMREGHAAWGRVIRDTGVKGD